MGMALMSLPTTKKNHINNKRRNIEELQTISAAHMIDITGIRPQEPLILCGKYNKTLPIIRQLVKMSTIPFVLIGTKRDLNETSCLSVLNIEWESETLCRTLSNGNGMFLLQPSSKTYLGLRKYLSGWDSHLIIMCLGNGLQLDHELLNLLNYSGHYILLSETLERSVKYIDSCKLTVSELLSSMEYILVSSIGTAGKELLKVLPDFECEKITNTSNFSLHQDTPYKRNWGEFHHNAGGFCFSQSKTQESRCIFTQEDLVKMQVSNTMMIYNTRCSRIWTAQITH